MNPCPRIVNPKWRIIGIGLLAVALLGGCSAVKLGYGQAPTLAYWWLDSFANFDARQSRRLKDELQQWLVWHQQTQLVVYANHLARLRADAAQSLSAQQMCKMSDETRDLLVPAFERALPAAAELVLGLKPAQLEKIEAKHKERTAEMVAELLPDKAEDRQKAAAQRAIKRFEGFYGKLSREQQAMIEQSVQAPVFDTQVWLARRERRHKDMMDVMRILARDQPPAAQVQEQLRLLVRSFDGRSPVEPVAQAAALTAANCEIASRVHNSASAKQRQHLVDKLDGWEADARALASAAPSSAAKAVPEAVVTALLKAVSP